MKWSIKTSEGRFTFSKWFYDVYNSVFTLMNTFYEVNKSHFWWSVNWRSDPISMKVHETWSPHRDGLNPRPLSHDSFTLPLDPVSLPCIWLLRKSTWKLCWCHRTVFHNKIVRLLCAKKTPTQKTKSKKITSKFQNRKETMSNWHFNCLFSLGNETNFKIHFTSLV